MQNLEFDRLPPQHLEAERSLLGSILLDGDTLDIVLAEVDIRPDDFYRDVHAQTWSHMIALAAKGEPVDGVSLGDALEKARVLPREDVSDFLRTLVEGVPHAANGKYYAHIVKEKSVNRRLIETANEIIKRGYAAEHTGAELLALAEKDILAIGDASIGTKTFDAASLMEITLGNINRRRNGEFVGLSIGFPKLDDAIGGLFPGQLVIVAARPSIGKTALLMSAGLRFAEQENRVLLISLEMSAAELGERMLAYYSGIPSHLLRMPKLLSAQQSANLLDADEYIRGLPIAVDDRSGRTVGQIAALARRMRSRQGLDVLLIDQLSLVDGERERGQNREQVVAKISRGLKLLAQELGVPILLAHQLNRQVESRDNKQPLLSDLRESGQVEADADVALLLNRPEFYDAKDRPGEADVFIAKNRNGRTGAVPLAFSKSLMRFDPLEAPQPLSIFGGTA